MKTEEKTNFLEYIKESVAEQQFEAVLSDDPKYSAEDYPFQLSIEQIYPENYDDEFNFGCHGSVEDIDDETIRNFNAVSAMNFACEQDAMDVACIMSSIVYEEYPQNPTIGVIVTYTPYEDEEDSWDCDEPWEHAFFIDEFNVWDEDCFEAFLNTRTDEQMKLIRNKSN